MTILITGASGFVGSFLASKFLKKKNKVIMISRNKKFSIENKIIRQVDINNFKKLESLFKQGIDYVIHCASLNEKLTNKYKNLAYTTAIKGTKNLLKLSLKYKVKKFFFFSVLQVYGKEIFGTIKSKNKINIQNDYANSHFLAEELIKKYNKKFNLNVNILRLAYSFSSPINNNIKRPDLIPINFCIDAIKKSKINLNSNGASSRDFIHLNDVFLKINQIIKDKKEQNIYYNFSSGKTFKIIEIAKLVQNEATKILKKKINLCVNKKNKVKENKFTVPSDVYTKKISKKNIENKLRIEIKKIILGYRIK